MSHAKVVLTDGVIASVGSANLTPRSMLSSKDWIKAGLEEHSDRPDRAGQDMTKGLCHVKELQGMSRITSQSAPDDWERREAICFCEYSK
jgi:hypothetical protein